MEELKIDRRTLEVALHSLNRNKEMIFYAIQLGDATQKGSIKPEHFEKYLIVPEPRANKQFHIKLDWTKHPELFIHTANAATIHIASFAIIVCKESYPRILWVEEEQNPDLYGAQIILKLVRDAMGHMRTGVDGIARPFWDIKKLHRKRFDIKDLRITFDATDLDKQEFEFIHIGGLSNLLKIMDYLAEDLRARLADTN